ncbi:MAG: hypothetical protein JO247_01700 [Chloroflexi bacterium]|nr:hypothetical protein [Chloroflexota bacterium]
MVGRRGKENTAAPLPEVPAAALNAIRLGVEQVDSEGCRVYVSEVARALSAAQPQTGVLNADGCELPPDTRCGARMAGGAGCPTAACPCPRAGVSGALLVMLDVEQHETIRTSVGVALFPDNGADAYTAGDGRRGLDEATRRRPGRQTR